MKLDFLKERYDFELGRKDQLTSALTLPVGILTGLGGLLAAMARSFSYAVPFLTRMFVTMMVVDVIGFVVCLSLLARAYHAQTYVYLPLLADLEAAEHEFRDFNRYVEGTGGEVEETFSSHLRERIIKAADANTQSNDRRSKWMHSSRIALFWVLGLTALAVFPYVADQVQNKAKNIMAPGAQKPTQTQTPQGPAPPKPSFPENRVIKEGREPGNVKK